MTLHLATARALPGYFAPARAKGSRVAAIPHGTWRSWSALFALVAGLLTPFTVSFVGEMPVGELVLFAVTAWAGLCLVLNRMWPAPLFRHRFLSALLIAQGVAFVAYIYSDLYRHSSTHDMMRGWGRMVFLVIDLLAMAYLFSRGRVNLVMLLLGQSVGAVASALLLGPMFGDMWKFGVGAPLTCLVFLLAPLAGPWIAIFAAAAIGCVHFVLDYRSYGGVCLLAATLTFLQILTPRFRLWIAPLVLAGTVAAGFEIYTRTQEGERNRATRSNVERAAMVTAAMEAVQESPLVGHGSWFSNSNVYDNFILIRHLAAKKAHVGGFAGPNTDPGNVALHSQILVALAEGGLFGGAFFFVFGGGLLWALWRTVFVQSWHRLAPLYTLLLLSAFWNLLFSPFSGAHRVLIAMACGLILLISRPVAGKVPLRRPSHPATLDLDLPRQKSLPGEPRFPA